MAQMTKTDKSGKIDKSHKSHRSAKFIVPQLAVTVPRQRLFAWLDQHEAVPLVWITAAPGMGKTTLMSTYLNSKNIPFVWYRFDQTDTTLNDFFKNLATACNQCFANALSLPVYTREESPDPVQFAERFFEVLFQSQDAPFAIVFDNLEQGGVQEMETILCAIAGQAVGRARLFVTSRPMPRPALLTLAARQQILLVGDSALAFDDDECVALASRVGVSADFMRAARLRLNGWASGLTLSYTFERMRLNDPFSGRDVAESDVHFAFFSRTFYSHQNRETKALLMSIFMLETISVSAVDALYGSADGMAILRGLHEANLFVERIESQELVYRFHPAFAEFLDGEAKNSLGDEGRRLVLKKAAAWLGSQGELKAAMHLYIQSAAWIECVQLLISNATVFWDNDDVELLGNWFDQIPDMVILPHASLLLLKGQIYGLLEDARAGDALIAAIRAYQTDSDQDGVIKASAVLMDFAYNEWADIRLYAYWASPLLRLKADDLVLLNVADLGLVFRGLMSVALVGTAKIESLQTLIDAALPVIQQGKPSAQLHATVQLLEHYSNLRDWDRAAAVAGKIETLLLTNAIPVSFRARALARFSYYFSYRRGEYEQAVLRAEEALALAKRHHLRFSGREATITLSLVALMRGDVDGAARYIKLESQFAQQHELAARANIQYETAWLHAIKGELSAAERAHAIAEELFSQSGEAGVMALSTPLQKSQLLALRGEMDAARKLLSGDGMTSPLWRVQSALLEALQCHVAEPALAKEKIREGLAIARQYQLTGSLWAMRDRLAELLDFALRNDIEPAWTRRLIMVRSLVPSQRRSAVWPWHMKIRLLGDFSIEDENGRSITEQVSGKPLALLKLVALRAPHFIDVTVVCETIWPEGDSVTARRSFDTTLHRLRSVPLFQGVFVVQGGQISLDRKRIWVDVEALYEVTQAVQKHASMTDHTAAIPEVFWLSIAQEFLGLVSVTAVATTVRQFGAPQSSLQKQVRAELVRQIVVNGEIIGEQLERCKRWHIAHDVYSAVLVYQPLAETLRQGLVRCLAATR
jgi:LuxR family transcriptional regulator, maltose regulon positive regulatory protein